MKYYLLSHITRYLLGRLRKYHSDDVQLLVFSKDFIGEEVFAYGTYEKHEINIISRVLDFDTKNNTVLDVGANIGNHAVQFSRFFKKVISFEPNPLIFEVLKLNTQHLDNIEIHNVGLSNENKKAFLDISKKNHGGATIIDETDTDKTPIQLIKGDDLLIDNFAFIKIDVEGHEIKALEGLVKSITENQPVLCFEFIRKEDPQKNIFTFLQNLGYTSFYIPHRRSIFPSRFKKRFFMNFIDGLIFKNKHELILESEFNDPFYNLIFCEQESSRYRLKQTAIKK